jgi:hypothetical protein
VPGASAIVCRVKRWEEASGGVIKVFINQYL